MLVGCESDELAFKLTLNRDAGSSVAKLSHWQGPGESELSAQEVMGRKWRYLGHDLEDNASKTKVTPATSSIESRARSTSCGFQA